MKINLNKTKNLLEEKKVEIVNRISRLEKNKRRSGGILSADSSEQAVEIQNDEVVDTMDKIEQNELIKITKALSAISDGTYGLCHDCGENISNSRINAMPFSILCLECAQ